MSQKYSDKIYSKCCKIFKAYLTSRRVNLFWLNREIITSDFLKCSYFLNVT